MFESLIHSVKQSFGDAFAAIVIGCVVGLLGMTAFGLLTFAVYQWGQWLAGPVVSAGALSAIYLALALAIWLVWRSRRDAQRELEASSSRSPAEALPRFLPDQRILALAAGLKELGRVTKSPKLAPGLMLAALLIFMLQRSSRSRGR